MTQYDLHKIGEALYGERWQTALAKALGISPRYVRSWLQGRAPVPQHRVEQIRDLCGKRMAEIERERDRVF